MGDSDPMDVFIQHYSHCGVGFISGPWAPSARSGTSWHNYTSFGQLTFFRELSFLVN